MIQQQQKTTLQFFTNQSNSILGRLNYIIQDTIQSKSVQINRIHHNLHLLYQPAWPFHFFSSKYCDIIFKPYRQIYCSRLRKVQLFCLKHNRYTTRQCRGVFFKTARNNLQADPGGHEQYFWDIKMANENICPMSARTRLKVIILDCQIITRSSFT